MFKGTFDKNEIRRIAVNKNNQMQIAYCKKYFPDVELVYCSSIEACLREVQQEKADGTVVNTLRTELVTGNSKYKSLSVVQLKGDDSRCFGVNENNTELMLILNRGLRIIGSSFGMESSYKYMGEFYIPNLGAFFLKYMIVFLPLLILVVGGIILLLAVSLHRKAVQVNEKEAHIRQVQTLNEELDELRRKADAANEAKTKFLFNMSHDIRTPMNAIMGFTGLLKSHLDDRELAQGYIGKIETASDFLLSLINNVLEMARIESGKIILDETSNNVYAFWDGLRALFDTQMKEKGVAYSREIQVDHPDVMVDATKLREILLNIVSNAVKYTPSGGSISVSVTELPAQRPGYLVYQTVIADTGIGMSEEFLPHIFEEFTRERTSTESKVVGSGLGMPIVKKLVDLMQGTIAVESELGKGTKFTLTLSHRIADTADTKPESEYSNPCRIEDFVGKRVLLAEDNELNAEIAITILETEGFLVERAEDGVICVDMLEKAPSDYYDLVLMDIQMPNMDGYKATRLIRKLPDQRKADIPIIAMTANAFEEDRKNAFRMGMNGHIAKPMQLETLKNTLGYVFSIKEEDREIYEP
ncbi:MAG: ATP-binding protein [Bacillota bacterium]|nr:ATP-binding protein [Bacillota bacterium]